MELPNLRPEANRLRTWVFNNDEDTARGEILMSLENIFQAGYEQAIKDIGEENGKK